MHQYVCPPVCHHPPCSPWTGRVYDRLLVATDGQGSLTLDGFLALWVYMTSREPRKTLAYLLYLGACGCVPRAALHCDAWSSCVCTYWGCAVS